MNIPDTFKQIIINHYQKKGYSNFDERWWEEFKKNPGIIKHYLEWETLRDGKTNTLEFGLPWYTYSAIDWLKGYLKPDMKVFEWGSGGSTIFYAAKVQEVVSVEHDPVWYKDVAKKIRKDKLKNAKALLIEPKKSSIKLASSKPGDYRSANAWMNKLDFKTYCTYIEKFADESFNLVAVDGRARTSCVLEGIPKVKSGGYLLLDNSDRERYESGTALMKGWERTDFTGPLPYIDDFLRTSIFKKP